MDALKWVQDSGLRRPSWTGVIIFGGLITTSVGPATGRCSAERLQFAPPRG
jgi:hypothetical protein